MSPHPGRSSRKRPNGAIVCLALGQTFVWAGLYYIFPALLLRWEEVWPKTALAACFAGALAVSAALSPWAGRLIDRGHGGRLMVGSALAGAVLLALLPLAGGITGFAILWLGIGAAMAGCLYDPCFAQVTRALGAAARGAITRITLVAGFAGTVSFPLNHAVAEAAGWRAATLASAGLVALVGVPLLWLGLRLLDRGPVAAPPETAAAAPAAGNFLRSPLFWLLAGSFAGLALNHGVIISHLLPILADRNIGPEVAVVAASSIGPMQVAGRLAMLAMERRVSLQATTVMCFVAMSAAPLCLYGAAAGPLLIIAFVALQGAGWGMVSILRPVIVRETFGDAGFGTVYGWTVLPFLMAMAAAPFLGALLWSAGGYDLTLVTVAAVAGLSLAAYRRARHAGPG